MKDVSVNDGRTVLFVSHHLPSVRILCEKALLLASGKVELHGKVDIVLEAYQNYSNSPTNGYRNNLPNDKSVYFTSWKLAKKDNSDAHTLYSKSEAVFELNIDCKENIYKAEFGFILRDNDGNIIIGLNSRDNGKDYVFLSKGKHKVLFKMLVPFKPDSYEIDVAIAVETQLIDHWVSDTKLRVLNPYESVLDERWSGLINLDFDFTTLS